LVPFSCPSAYHAGTMDEWDQETLEKVVAAKGNEFIHNKPTEIVCIFSLLFLSEICMLSAVVRMSELESISNIFVLLV
jgi:hypothetical protein